MSLFTFAVPGWNALAFAVPAWCLSRVLANINPQSYKALDARPKSSRASAVRTIMQQALNAENVQGSKHFKRIQGMLKTLPESAGPKTIQTLVQHRLKVLHISPKIPPYTQGTDAHHGKYFICVHNSSQMEPVLPWIVTREVSHILNNDVLNRHIIATITSLAVAVLSVFALGLSLPASLGAVMLTNAVAHAIYFQMAERTADNFANKHCSKEQLEQGIAYLELVQAPRATYSYANRFFAMLLDPSEDSRIAGIRKALLEKAKTV